MITSVALCDILSCVVVCDFTLIGQSLCDSCHVCICHAVLLTWHACVVCAGDGAGVGKGRIVAGEC